MRRRSSSFTSTLFGFWWLMAMSAMAASCSFGSEAPDGAMAAAADLERVELRDPGAEPRFELRYRLKAGQKVDAVATDEIRIHQHLVSDVEGASETVEVQSDATIATQASVVVTAAESSADGTLYSVETEVTGFELIQASPPELVDSLGGVGADLVGTRTVRTWDDRGRGHGDDAAGDGDSGSVPGSIALSATLPGGDVVVLPEEPVGEGARWRVERDAGEGNEAHQLVEVTLLSVESDQEGRPTLLDLKVEGHGTGDDRSEFTAVFAIDLSEPLGSGQVTSSAVDVVEIDPALGAGSIEQTTDVTTSVQLAAD